MAGERERRPLSPGEKFDLALRVREALLDGELSHTDDKHLVEIHQIELLDTEDGDGVDWTATFVSADQDRLLELATYLRVAPADGLPETASPVEKVGPSPDAYVELVAVETALRDVVRLSIHDWPAQLGEDALARLEEKRAEEEKKRDGITVSHDLLDYTEIRQLESLIEKNWQSVKPILDDLARTKVYLSIVSDVRNTIGHSRPVVISERQLLSGAAGQIRNQLARYRSDRDGAAVHYSSIASARDSFGTDGDPRDIVHGRDDSQDPRLDVGDKVVFELEGTDPRGRSLTWALYIARGHGIYSYSMAGVRSTVTGARVSLEWNVTRGDVGEETAVAIVLRNSSEFQRDDRGHDDLRIFHYKVNPPMD